MSQDGQCAHRAKPLRPRRMKCWTSDQHLSLECFAPVENFRALAQTTDIERVRLHKLQDRHLGWSFNNSQASLRHVPRFRTQRARDQHCRLVLRDPLNVRLQVLGPKSPMAWLVCEDDREEHGCQSEV